MSSRPNSSLNHPKNMYSSLPSASKIYVSSTTKSKPKNIHSARRKRKKSEADSRIVENISVSDETLISVSSPIRTPPLITFNATDSPQNTVNKADKTLRKEESVEKFLQIDESDSDSYTLDDKVKVVNSYFDVCIESDEFNEEQGIPTYEFREMFGDIKINESIHDSQMDEAAETKTSTISDMKLHENVTSKIIENSAPESLISDSTIKMKANEINDSESESLVNETVKEKNQNSIAKELSCLTSQNRFSEEDSLCVPESEVILTKPEFEIQETQSVKNISCASDSNRGDDNHSSKCDADFKLKLECVSAVENEPENSYSQIFKHNDTDNSSGKTNNPHTPDIPQLKTQSNMNETVNSSQYNRAPVESIISKDFPDETTTSIDSCHLDDTTTECFQTDEKACSKDCFNTGETTDLKDCLNNDERTMSKDCFEQDSCTESELYDLNADHCNEFMGKASRDSNITIYESNAKSRIRLFHLKRSISMPENLQSFRKKENFHIDNGSSITLSSNKATITSDLYTEDGDKQLERLNEDRKFRDSDCNTVASGADLPSVDILPALTMLKAKMRNYVFGWKGLDGALLGSEELSRFFPNNKITVFVGTWNMNGHDPPKNIDDFLLPHDSEILPDIYAIGVQESMQSKSEWELMLQTTLGPSHVLFTSTSLGVLHLAIFLRRDLIWFCSEPEEGNIATRVGSMVKTKGAVAICFMLFGTSFLFLNSHLTAHEQNLVDRISDYEKICSGLDLPKNIPSKINHQNKNVTSRFDCVFWCGDLNFRIMWNRTAVIHFMRERDPSSNESCRVLLKHDQLHRAIEEGAAFHGFQEGFINFDPSFKFDVGTNDFDSAKQRVPSYTDRILYRFKDSSTISCLHYNSVPEIVTSDHKPVYGIFRVSLKPGRDSVPLAAGIFKRDVYLEALKRRANFLEVNRNSKQSAVCSVM